MPAKLIKSRASTPPPAPSPKKTAGSPSPKKASKPAPSPRKPSKTSVAKDTAVGAPIGLQALTAMVVFVILFASQSWIVKWGNKKGIELPWFNALMLSAAWPLTGLMSFAYYRYYKEGASPKLLTKEGAKAVTILGFVDAMHMILLSFGLNYLPASTYMILKSTNLPFTAILSWGALGQKVSKMQLISMAIVFAAVVVLGMGKSSDAGNATWQQFIFSSVVSLLSALLNALHSVLGSVYMNKLVDKKSFKGLLEVNTLNGMATFLWTLPFVACSGEHKIWPQELGKLVPSICFLMWFGVAFSKQMGYLAKFAVVKLTGPLTESMLDVLRRCVVSVGAVFLFGDSFKTSKQVSMALMIFGMGLYFKGDAKQKK
mmetsp:Transcript_96778/g.172145  ORF Transcript_96778/g.172145 Transcript_96778/m.172145 type:complete len:372 (-) Transcript_96778:98-1213(-)|eukprot:CAMPEP_0197631578 /NCGR_PEP_ID=MMETSP1338-20131121/8701_1 /TAXON_ID=43686 ORGANISM="Pelagodinium beii, Strain RCC1491" /NCGR_SAMPLE_ID=MMETSP1338 /ASSEMBLY_ACC=CAM_ASM_000754 /LENGTH=371 /DNA_ID=CAMNT_0043203071 /DNA_START=49 /DNA_END=1164 /DNA_ORIENTATION=-